jgi:hypothetical protein
MADQEGLVNYPHENTGLSPWLRACLPVGRRQGSASRKRQRLSFALRVLRSPLVPFADMALTILFFLPDIL